MDALHPRLLTADFAAAFRFYDAVLPPLTGAVRTRGDAGGPYASWDVGGQGALTLLDRAAMAAVTGAPSAADTAGTPGAADNGGDTAGPARDRAMLVSRVDDVAVAYDLCLRHGAVPVGGPADRPEWGPAMRTSHVRDLDGNLLEFQSY